LSDANGYLERITKRMMNTHDLAPVLVAGEWRPAKASGNFHAENPATREKTRGSYPISEWADADAALEAAAAAFQALQALPLARIACFLRDYADRLASECDRICTAAAEETAYPLSPRLRDVEMVRTINQLRQAARAAEESDWRLPQIDVEANICSILEPLGPVVVFGPNNFPLAFNGISGGDFASAIASGNPVIAKAHSSHPATCRLLAECAQQAAERAQMPRGTVQMLYGVRREDGVRLVSDPRLGAAAFTGSRSAGMKLKAAADAVGKPIFLEMSSVNPIVILPGALEERFDVVLDELAASALLGTGQFCTNPGIVFVVKGGATEGFLKALTEKYKHAPHGTLLGEGTEKALAESIDALVRAGATVLCGNERVPYQGYALANTLLHASGEKFLRAPSQLQTEAFGNATLVVVADDLEQLPRLLACCEGNLAGSVYSALDGRDDSVYDTVASVLRPRTGRLLNDKMPTGVAVSPAMNHGGPFPATGHPHFTSVGLPASMRRFTRLACYDNVRPDRLPAELREMMRGSGSGVAVFHEGETGE
jgi:2,5-dioxopentanoate dehydrogenase